MGKGFHILIWALFVAGANAQVFTNAVDNKHAEGSNILVRILAQSVLDDKHLLEPGDKISFQVLEDKHPPVKLVVTDSDELDVPYLGRVSVAGKTCRRVAAELKVELEKDYYYRATVIVGLDSVNQLRGQAFVAGAVNKQGSVDILFNQNITVGEAIIQMGGFTDFADKRKVRVVRRYTTGNSGKTNFVVNVQDVMDKGKLQDDLVLEPGDYVIVPEKIIRF